MQCTGQSDNQSVHSRDLVLYLVLTVFSLVLVCQFYCIYKHLAKIKNLEVRKDKSEEISSNNESPSETVGEQRSAEIVTETAPALGQDTAGRKKVVFQTQP